MLRTTRLVDSADITLLALVTGQVAKEITDIGKEIEHLFGVISEDMLKLQ
jgi:hypothetical protein